MAAPSGEMDCAPRASPPTDSACAFAHSRNASGRRHSLVDHLVATAKQAGEFGAPFGAAADCYAAGLWHDIGKVDPAFQDYLAACEQGRPHARVDHKTAGALLAAGSPTTAHLAQIILGHHGGMPDRGRAGALLAEHAQDRQMREAAGWGATALPKPPVPGGLGGARGAALDVRLRLIFSAVVDADFLDTEAHFDVARHHARQLAGREGIDHLADRELDAHARFLAGRRWRGPVDAVRADVRDAALRASGDPPGLFRLTVPTGGGKTRTALAFALNHAVRHGLRRVVTAVPFITVTDQTAQVYRDVLGRSSVLEHHSGIDVERHVGDARERLWRRLAAENWDAPVVVTTTVQLFESLFSNRPSALRKAHRLARSVVILDEAQVLRLAVLGVTIDMLAALTRVAGSTIVLCTATQPAIEQIAELADGAVREIVPDYEKHFAALRRVSFAVPAGGRDGRGHVWRLRRATRHRSWRSSIAVATHSACWPRCLPAPSICRPFCAERTAAAYSPRCERRSPGAGNVASSRRRWSKPGWISTSRSCFARWDPSTLSSKPLADAIAKGAWNQGAASSSTPRRSTPSVSMGAARRR